MMKHTVCGRLGFAITAFCFLQSGGARCADYPPADHGGADLLLQDNDRIWGNHTGIGTFRVPEGATVSLKPYDGADSATGRLEVHANSVELLGILDATGAGYSGGSGGGGTPGSQSSMIGPPPWPITFGAPGEGGLVPYEKENLRGASPGEGGTGDGPFGGLGGGESTAIVGADGGYLSPSGNGDSSIDESTSMGSGGGGGRGGAGVLGHNEGAQGGSGGAAGGRGGGELRFFALNQLLLGPQSRLLADGQTGGDSPDVFGIDGGDGGNVEPAGEGRAGTCIPAAQPGSDGGAGAGGGVLLDAMEAAAITINSGAAISALGGRDQASNGGTIKLLLPGGTPYPFGLAISAGRLYTNLETPSNVGDAFLFY